jgi:membrane protease YdiL (CAAX protease family)
LRFSKKDIYFSVFILAIFIALEEVYMLMLDIEMPQGFIDFMLSDPIILSLISVLIIAPIAEEFIFRGFLFSQLSRTRLGAWGALSISSFLWTIIHFQYEFKILLILFIFGIFLGYIRMAYNSLGLPIAIHAINNLVAFLVAYYYV